MRRPRPLGFEARVPAGQRRFGRPRQSGGPVPPHPSPLPKGAGATTVTSGNSWFPSRPATRGEAARAGKAIPPNFENGRPPEPVEQSSGTRGAPEEHTRSPPDLLACPWPSTRPSSASPRLPIRAPLNRRDAKSAARRSRKSEVRRSKAALRVSAVKWAARKESPPAKITPRHPLRSSDFRLRRAALCASLRFLCARHRCVDTA